MEKSLARNLLKKIQLFSSLNDRELSEIETRIAIRKFKKNQTILYEEDTNQLMYMILEGRVKVTQMTEDGKEILLAMHRAGEFFGEISLIDAKTVPALVLATEDSIIATINRAEFYELLFLHRKVLDNLLEIMCSRLREAWSRVQILSFNNASQRVRMLFLLLSGEYGRKTDEGMVLDIKLTHQEIANMVGITRETVTRIIDKWNRDGDISILKNKSVLMKLDFLKKDLANMA